MNGYRLVQLASGSKAVYVEAYGERMHPGLGPAMEAELLYVRQLRIRGRMRDHAGEFVVWDVGLGAGANALALLRLTRDLACPLRLVSFDDTADALAFALKHAEALGYFRNYEAAVSALLEHRRANFQNASQSVRWEFHLGDFPAWLASIAAVSSAHPPPAPHAVFFDAFSPAKNPGMWTLPVFTNLFRRLDPRRPCDLTTYSRSTMIRVTLLLAGFFVGRGQPSGWKEETTVAANRLEMLASPLDSAWLERARRSGSAEPLIEPVYRQQPLRPETWETLRRHPQFAGVGG